MKSLRHALHLKLLRHGWLVQQIPPTPHGWLSGRTYWDAEYIGRLGFRPRTLVDVGVAQGTPTLYEAFPEAYLVMVEPLAEFSTAMRSILAKREGIIVPTAVGDRVQSKTILVEPHYIERSSVYERDPVDKTGDSPQPREVPVTTLDLLQAEYRWKPPFGLKIDTEGCELSVILGARDFLRDTLFVIAEVNIFDRFPNSYSFAEFVKALDESGFALCDILDISRTSRTELNFVDLVFHRKSANGAGGLPCA